MAQRYIMIIAGLLLASCADSFVARGPSPAPAPAATPNAAYVPQQAAMPAPGTVAPPLPVQQSLQARTVKVGLLLPLSGQSAGIGNALRDAAVMALFDKYATLSPADASTRVELVTKDTRGTPEGARQAAAEAVREGASLLLGPLFSRSVDALKPLAKTGKVTIVSFSNRKQVAGDGVFLMGFDPAEQARRVANFAYRRDIQNIAALAPNDAYGREVIGAFNRVAELLGRRLQPLVRYASAGATLDRDVRMLAKEGTSGARFTFGALLLPEAGPKLGPILSGLKAANITSRTVQFIGTGLWDDDAIIRNHALDGAWIASSPPEGYEAFEQRFKATYGSHPPRLASLSYDAVALAATLATGPAGMTRKALMSPSGYYGPANGIFRFHSNGTIERGLAVLQVDGARGFRVIDPAPTSFR